MANPTTNYGFVLPTSTDLVTDLPADFDIALQGVDTRLKALQPGTTLGDLAYSSATANTNTRLPIGSNGQVLAVAAGVPTWTTTADVTPLTTKGDLFTFTTVDARLAVGADGETLVADSSTSSGLRYTALFGANKNKIINGDFNINQRAFTSTTTDGAYGFDRWNMTQAGGCTYSAQTFTTGAAPVAGYEGTNYARLLTSGQSTTTDEAVLSQRIESVRSFAGQTVTISFWAQAGSATPKIAVELDQQFGSGGSTRVTTYAGQVTLSTTWARYSVTIAVPSISGKTIGTANDFLGLRLWVSAGSTYNARTGSLGLQNNTFNIWGVQVEAGSVATAFQTATGTIQGELAACQRYFQIFGGNDVFEYYGIGANLNTVNANCVIQWYVPMRTAPTTTFTTASNYRVTQGTSANTCTGAVGDILTKNNAAIQFTVASGLTSGNAVRCLANNTLSGTISVSAEL